MNTHLFKKNFIYILMLLTTLVNLNAQDHASELSDLQKERLALRRKVKAMDLPPRYLCQIELNNKYYKMKYAKNLIQTYKEYSEQWSKCVKPKGKAQRILSIYRMNNEVVFSKNSDLEANRILDHLKKYDLKDVKESSIDAQKKYNEYIKRRVMKSDEVQCYRYVNTTWLYFFSLMGELYNETDDQYEKETILKSNDMTSLYSGYKSVYSLCQKIISKYYKQTSRLQFALRALLLTSDYLEDIDSREINRIISSIDNLDQKELDMSYYSFIKFEDLMMMSTGSSSDELRRSAELISLEQILKN